MTIDNHVIDGALDAANKKLREVSKRISKELGAQMTKFKVGDRVALSGIIQSIDDDYPRSYKVFLDGDDSYSRFNEATMNRSDTSFRDQAAIAALQGLIAGHGQRDITEFHVAGVSSVAFDFAVTLDAERKKRDGGE